MDKFENGPTFDDVPDNEFELEMIDLPPDEEAAISVVLAAEGLRVLFLHTEWSNDGRTIPFAAGL